MVITLSFAQMHLGKVTLSDQGPDKEIFFDIDHDNEIFEELDPLPSDFFVLSEELECIPFGLQRKAPYVVSILS